ncbi:MAG: putative glutathione S-transferase [Rhodospirillales bacterium]|nr:putative glutathione S-transferase [Rhodospirillales bacterium]
MMRARSSLEICDQLAISASVRRQPTQTPLAWSNWQTFTQGDSNLLLTRDPMILVPAYGLWRYEVSLHAAFGKTETSMADITVHGIPGSPYVRAALLGLEEKAAPYTLVPMAPMETKQPAHLGRHPFGRIPAFAHGDFQLYETQAILRYVDAVLPGIALRPIEPRAAARMDQMVGIVDWYFFRDISATISFNRVIAPAFGMPTDEAAVAAAIPKAAICLAELDRLIGDNAFVAGDSLSIADLMLAPQMEFFSATPESVALLKSHPRLGAWLTRMQDRQSMRNTSWEKLKQAS